jgi:hypothetical protein
MQPASNSRFPLSSHSQTHIILSIPPGKPDTAQVRPCGPDTRKRVKLTIKTHNNSVLNAINLLRDRIGKIHPPELVRQREIERLCKGFEKEMMCLRGNIDPLSVNVENPLIKEILPTIKKEHVPRFLQIMDLVAAVVPQDKKQACEDIKSWTKKFADQTECETFEDYLGMDYYGKRLDAYLKFLNSNNVNPHLKFDDEKLIFNGNSEFKRWELLTLKEKCCITHSYVNELIADMYGFIKTHWDPSSSITFLIEQLKQMGPLIVVGSFGKKHYLNPPQESTQQIDDRIQNCVRKVFFWPKNSPVNGGTEIGAVIIIGAKVETRDNKTVELVYFIDPEEDSDPNHIEYQKIYMMSYQNLQNNSANLRNILFSSRNIGGWGLHPS